jgi:hypothetical protein
MNMSQSRRLSLAESVVYTAISLLVTPLLWFYIITPLLEIEPLWYQSWLVIALLASVSIARYYVVRRFFEWIRAMASEDGAEGTAPETWGKMLGRDVQVIADKCGAIILLPGWEKSKGARLETFVALLCGYPIWEYTTLMMTQLHRTEAMGILKRNTI